MNPAFLRQLQELGFFALCLLVLAGTRPFEGGNIQDHSMHSRGAAGEAALYLGFTAVCIAASMPRLRLSVMTSEFFWIGMLTAYCAISLTWSTAINEGTTRFVQYLLVTGAVICVCATMTASRSLALFSGALGVVMLADIASVVVVTNATHLYSDLTEDLTGAWKGVHIHKNYAGVVAGLATLIFGLRACYFRRPADFLIAGLGIVMLAGSSSKTSAFLTLATFVFLLVLKSSRRLFGSQATRWTLAYLAFCALVLSPFLVETIGGMLADGRMFTGRVELWNVMAMYVQTHPLTGSGFASFWRVGESSPIFSLTQGWGVRAGQGHNGYLDATVTLGVPGLLLTLMAFVVTPVVLVIRGMRASGFEYDACFCLVVFSLMHNMSESSLLGGNHPVFLALLIGVAALTKFVRSEAVSVSYVGQRRCAS